MISLKNLTKRTVIFNLPHASACSETECTCSRMKVGVVDHDKATGDRTVRAVNQRLGHSVTLFPKGTKGDNGEALDVAADLLDNVATVSEIVQAKARREIEIIRQVAPAAPAAEPEPEGQKPEQKPNVPPKREKTAPAPTPDASSKES